jgi:hypothetical protein
MILVRFTGGLGNQLFQYAVGTALAVKNKTVLKIDTTFLLDRSQPHEIVTHRNLDIDILNVQLHFASEAEINHFNGKAYPHLVGKIFNKLLWELGRKKRLVIEHQRNFIPEILDLGDDQCLVGAWQSEKYFKAVIPELKEQYTFRQELKGQAESVAREIRQCSSLCLNVRRGDYVTSPVYSKTLGAMPVEYFNRSMEKLRSLHKIDNVFVFSDDLTWCKNHLFFKEPTTFVEHDLAGEKFGTYLQLMSLCKHFIIPNSTFGWWAAWMGNSPEKTVIAPRQWFLDSSYSDADLIPENWIRI